MQTHLRNSRGLPVTASLGLVTIVAFALAFLANSDHGVVVPQPESASADAPATGPIPTSENLKVAFIGDSGAGTNFTAVLNLIEAEGADLIVHEGDFDYVDDPDGFFAAINGAIGPTYPLLLTVGNHDIASWPTTCTDPDGCYATLFKQRLTASGITLDDPNVNDQMYSTDFGGLSMIFVGQTGTQTGDCPANPNGYACYIRNKLATDRHIWRFCSWHKNQQAMQVGNKTDEMGWDVYNNCVDFGAFIGTGHEHSYERTKTLTDPEHQTVDLVQHPLVSGVPSNPNSLRVMPGASFAFVSGLGGREMRPQTRCLPATYPYGCSSEWASIYSTNQTNNVSRYGALFIEFYVDGDPYKAHGYFKTTTGQIIDSFDIHADFHDADDDGIQDALDNCVDWNNPGQGLPSWNVPANDTDCDGFSSATETAIGTSPSQHCAATAARNDETGPDAWPADFNDDGKLNVLDLSQYSSRFNAESPGPPYAVRYDLNADNRINVLDLSQFSAFFAKSCM